MRPRRRTTSSRLTPTAMLGPEKFEGRMAELVVVYWRDIPRQVIVKKGRQNAKRELSVRFEEAIDMAAMRSGAAGTTTICGGGGKPTRLPLATTSTQRPKKAAADLEAQFPRDRLVALAKAGGHDA